MVDCDLCERANAAVVDVRPDDGAEPGNRAPSSTEELGRGVPASPVVPRISRLLALALKMEEMIQEGTVNNYSHLAPLSPLSPSPLTQPMNLLHLPPDIHA